MIGFEQIMGQRDVIELLERMLGSGRIPHALIFQGPEGIGKATVAGAFAAALLCRSPVGDGACGACECCRLLEHGNHPDLTRVGLQAKPGTSGATSGAPVAEEDLRRGILVDQIRELSQLAAFTPRLSRRRVFLIDPADRMVIAAQNALLKTLEEPAGASVLILIAARPHLLLPTVRSRCFALRFAALPAARLAELLEQRGHGRDEALARAALSEGRPGRALDLDLDATRERRLQVLEQLEALSSESPPLDRLPSMAAELAGKSEPTLLAGLELVEGILRDASRAACGTDESTLVHVDLSNRLLRLGTSLGPRRAARILEALASLRGDLRFNVNRTLTAESLLAAVAGGPIPGRR